MRWSEDRLQAHLNKHQNRKIQGQARFKSENDAKVREARLKLNTCITERNTASDDLVILDCEIASMAPSVNHYWNTSGKRRYLSDKAISFHRLIRSLVPAHNSAARLKLDVTFHFTNKQRRDIDNYLKATIDSLVKCGLCVDDEQFDELVVRRGHVVKGGLIKLKVMEI